MWVFHDSRFHPCTSSYKHAHKYSMNLCLSVCLSLPLSIPLSLPIYSQVIILSSTWRGSQRLGFGKEEEYVPPLLQGQGQIRGSRLRLSHLRMGDDVIDKQCRALDPLVSFKLYLILWTQPLVYWVECSSMVLIIPNRIIPKARNGNWCSLA